MILRLMLRLVLWNLRCSFFLFYFRCIFDKERLNRTAFIKIIVAVFLEAVRNCSLILSAGRSKCRAPERKLLEIWRNVLDEMDSVLQAFIGSRKCFSNFGIVLQTNISKKDELNNPTFTNVIQYEIYFSH